MTHFPSQDQDLREGVWYRDGSLLYTLQPHINRFGRVKGWENRSTVRVDGPGAEATLAQIEAALSAPPRPEHTVGGADEIRAAFNDAAEARDEAGYAGTPASCIRFLSAEVEKLEKAIASPTQAPDKAGEREGLKTRMVAALDGKTAYSRDCHLSGEYLCGLVWPMVEEALAPKPTGTEAGRGVGEEKRSRLPGPAEYLAQSTPTPPVSPDSPPAGARITFSEQVHRDAIGRIVSSDSDGETLARVVSDASLLHAALGTGPAKGFMPETIAAVRHTCAALHPSAPTASEAAAPAGDAQTQEGGR